MNKYFNDIDLSRADVAKVDALINNTISALFTGGITNSTITFFEKELKTKEDYVKLINEILSEAFDSVEDINKCKAIFAIYISGLNLTRSNMFGLIKLLLVAVRSCGALLNVDVYVVFHRYMDEIRSHKLETLTVGSISKCNFLGEKIDFDSNDTFARANDDRYSTRILGNVRDYDKIHGPEYNILLAAYRKIEPQVQQLKANQVPLKDKDGKEVKDSTGNTVYTTEYNELVNDLIARKKRRNNIDLTFAQGEKLFQKILANKAYQAGLQRYNNYMQNIPPQKTTRLENFD